MCCITIKNIYLICGHFNISDDVYGVLFFFTGNRKININVLNTKKKNIIECKGINNITFLPAL